jgi:hypothetical protein
MAQTTVAETKADYDEMTQIAKKFASYTKKCRVTMTAPDDAFDIGRAELVKNGFFIRDARSPEDHNGPFVLVHRRKQEKPGGGFTVAIDLHTKDVDQRMMKAASKLSSLRDFMVGMDVILSLSYEQKQAADRLQEMAL